jgi:hypothetical protein
MLVKNVLSYSALECTFLQPSTASTIDHGHLGEQADEAMKQSPLESVLLNFLHGIPSPRYRGPCLTHEQYFLFFGPATWIGEAVLVVRLPSTTQVYCNTMAKALKG